MNLKELIFGARQPKTAVRADRFPDSITSWLPIRDIREGVILTAHGDCVKLLEVLPINFLYLSDAEQSRIVGYFANYLKIAPDCLQILCVTRPTDVGAYESRMRAFHDEEKDAACREMIEDNIREVRCRASNGALTTRFFLAFRYEPSMPLHGEGFAAVADALYDAETTARQYLSRCGLTIVQPDYADNFVVETVFGMLCKRASRYEKIPLYFRTMLSEVHGERSNDT